jgi:SAM-dependent methyltransferase
MKYEDDHRSIKYFVKRFFLLNGERFRDRKVVDFPAGNGITSRILSEIGAKPLAFDLFPEYFKVPGMTCTRANISTGIPLPDSFSDALICQEGLEHFSDQLSALKEFNRVLKPSGTLIITTPNYSNLRAKLSYLLSESERFNSLMPPNEIDSIWMSDQDITPDIYYGHLFLTGILKLRVLARLAGFKIKKIHPTRMKSTSMLLFPFLYPFIVCSNGIAYRNNIRKGKDQDILLRKQTYREIFNIAVNPRILVDSHLMVEFEKETEVSGVAKRLKGLHRVFGTT